jgi:hypothetical protein
MKPSHKDAKSQGEKMKKISIVIALIVSMTAISPAQAADARFEAKISTPEISLDVLLANFPTKGGMYIQQCVQAPAGTRPTICNKAAELWISTMRGASFAPTGKIVFKPTSTFTSGTTVVDCMSSNCGVFLRYDHTVPADFSEDQFIPLNFRSAVKNQSLGAFKVPASIKSGKKITFPKTTDATQPVTYAIAGACSIAKTTVTVRKGLCTILATASGTADLYAPFMGSYIIKSN